MLTAGWKENRSGARRISEIPLQLTLRPSNRFIRAVSLARADMVKLQPNRREHQPKIEVQ
jgi:hypothetical protein